MNSKQVILILLIAGSVCVAVSFNIAGVSKLSDATVTSTPSTSVSQSVQSGTIDFTKYQAPVTRQELLDDLQVIGINDAITMSSGYFHGTLVNGYQDILKLAVKGAYVVIPDDGIGVLVGINGMEFIWGTSTSSQYTKFEKVEIQSAQCVKGINYWTITLSLKNSGSATATLNNVYVNDQVATYRLATTIPVTPFTNLYADVDSATQKTILSGQTGTVTIYVGSGWPVAAPLTSGTTIDIKVHSAGGMDYIKLIGLV